MVRFEIEFEDEIAVFVRRGEDAIGIASRNGLTDDAAMVHIEFGVTGFYRPPRKVLAVEEMDPPSVGGGRQREERRENERYQFEFTHNEKCS